MFCKLSFFLRPGQMPDCRHVLSGAVLAVLVACGFPSAGIADDMADVQKALKEERYFDAFRELLDLSKAGNAQAQYELAGFYQYGRVGAADFTKARSWYQRSANQGNTDAMIGLAVMNAAGNGGPVDKLTAIKWLMIANNIQKLPANVAEWRDQLADEITPEDKLKIAPDVLSFKAQLEH